MFIKHSPSALQKLSLLVNGAKYDVSCASSGVQRNATLGKLGSTLSGGLCHSWSSDGRCISLLKTLQTNYCTNNCAYCVNRCKNNIERTFIQPDELAKITYEFYRRNYIEGLFLSSGIMHNPNRTMELMLDTVKILRTRYQFNGYIHLKILPGAEDNAIEEAILWADRVSINIELPTQSSLQQLAPQKDMNQILHTIQKVNSIRERLMYTYRGKGYLARSGQSTQMVIGASPESDRVILTLTEYLYKKQRLKRVYYSAYVPINEDTYLPAITTKPPLQREHRLYQADWLLRFYGFSIDEILSEQEPNLNEQFDPKVWWALNHLHLFPIEITKADLNQLLRVPGIGPISAKRILRARKGTILDLDMLKKLGVAIKRAKYFITVKGKYYGGIALNSPHMLATQLKDENTQTSTDAMDLFQYELANR
ncbi:MAG TPA: putative DNA modification/repair radical SAM protein [Candidatus Hydrogenedens sp.]|nr:putative DNA modification/repair radical SAM protein [Candidatus Hydrogenedens sp.]HOK10060.1 putative DNA modification/repair radical SAM protein [Candidatus Hydrogenedens sp.]HOL20226.1 putative DNA modification/repair radical SAM protein [Candidatus Hydrogenedens sp.]HPP59635.1 putative DNA modification/repair radical SAM protein [Candidatus Hydrogenedens sp.]